MAWRRNPQAMPEVLRPQVLIQAGSHARLARIVWSLPYGKVSPVLVQLIEYALQTMPAQELDRLGIIETATEAALALPDSQVQAAPSNGRAQSVPSAHSIAPENAGRLEQASVDHADTTEPSEQSVALGGPFAQFMG